MEINAYANWQFSELKLDESEVISRKSFMGKVLFPQKSSNPIKPW